MNKKSRSYLMVTRAIAKGVKDDNFDEANAVNQTVQNKKMTDITDDVNLDDSVNLSLYNDDSLADPLYEPLDTSSSREFPSYELDLSDTIADASDIITKKQDGILNTNQLLTNTEQKDVAHPFFDLLASNNKKSGVLTENNNISRYDTNKLNNEEQLDWITTSIRNIQNENGCKTTAVLDKVTENNNSKFVQEVSTSERNEIVNIAPLTATEITENNNKQGRMRNDGTLRKGNKKTDFCFYCEQHVLNFARHVLRNHKNEVEVVKISILKPASIERKKMLESLRKRGNYLVSHYERKAVKTPSVNETRVCSKCLGFYSTKFLFRHKKKCGGTEKLSSNMLSKFKIDPKLIDNVFPRMKNDEISFVAQKDILICNFGARYARIHREKHFEVVTSRKMRELARLLIELKKINPSIQSLFDALVPDNYDNIVSATKTVANFSVENGKFNSPSYAMNIATSLKQCCDIAIVFALKRKEVYSTVSAAEAESNLKTLIHLINTQWRFDISSQAADDMNISKWNKITIVPLAADLKTLKEFLILRANTAIESLKNETNCIYYVILLETVYCRVILLNRRRPGELQRLPLSLYKKIELQENYEEFGAVITETEKILLKIFKRIVIRGKRGRGVPVLFGPDIQNHIEVLLEHRHKYVSEDNIYLFANPGTKEPICGYKVLQKYAKLSKTKNPNAITCTRLRKHLATLTQLFSMSEGEIEQLASFMGHTIGVHRSAYRLPDDVFQTAKISKLLLLMEKGAASQYRGVAFEDINIDLDENLLENNMEEEMDVESIEDEIRTETPVVNDVLKLEEPKKRLLTPWTPEQKKVVLDFFVNHIKKKIPAKKHECFEIKNKYKLLLENKDWKKIKVFVQNQYQKLK